MQTNLEELKNVITSQQVIIFRLESKLEEAAAYIQKLETELKTLKADPTETVKKIEQFVAKQES